MTVTGWNIVAITGTTNNGIPMPRVPFIVPPIKKTVRLKTMIGMGSSRGDKVTALLKI